MNDTQHPAASPDPAAEKIAADGARFSSRRRRLLKIAGGAAPASLLLVGRPVHATYNCVSTSAWGSAMASASASTGSSHVTQIDGWSRSQWCSNSKHSYFGYPWESLCQSLRKWYGSTTSFDFAQAKQALTLSDCQFAHIPVGLLPIDNLHKALSGTCGGSSEYNKNVLVALLNQKLLSTAGSTPTNCAPAYQVDEMARGAFDPKSGKSAWGKTEISNYLKTNNLSRD